MRTLSAAVACICLATAVAQGQGLPKRDGPLALQAAVEEGLKNSLAVHSMIARTVAASHSEHMEKAMSGITASAGATLSSGGMAQVIPSSPDVTPPSFRLTPNTSYANQDVTLMVPLYTSGRRRALERAAAGQYRQAENEEGETRSATALAIREAYYGALLATEMGKVARARKETAAGIAANAQAALEAGRGIEAAVHRARAEEADAQRQVVRVDADFGKLLLQLKDAMGLDLDSQVTLSSEMDPPAIEGDLAASVKRALEGRPDLQAAAAAYDIADEQVAAARALRRPQVYGTLMADASTMASERTGVTAGVTIGLPIFDGGLRDCGVHMAEANREAARSSVERVRLRATAEVRSAWLDAEAAEANVAGAKAALTAAQSAYEVIALRVESQRGIQVEQLDALTALAQARANLAQARYDRAMAGARIVRAEGRV